MTLSRISASVFVALLLSGCRVPLPPPPPAAIAPAANTPADAYKEAKDWHPSQPSDTVARGAWWEAFGDPGLSALETQIDVSNQNLKIAEGNFTSARATVKYNRSFQYPTIFSAPFANTTRKSDNAPYASGVDNASNQDFEIPFDLSYEIDVWGRVRRVVQASREEAQAVDADLETVRLSLHAELASDYFNLRAADAQKALLDQTVESYKQALELTTNRFNEGAAPKSDVTQAQTQLQSAIVADSDISVQRDQYEHAIAQLVGKSPTDFAVQESVQTFTPPDIPTGLPSKLLERRPDIASAERRVAEANERIGLAKIAYYPTFSFGGFAGIESAAASTWFHSQSMVWSLGPSFVETLFDAGRRRATTTAAAASYDQYVAVYRQTVLAAFQQVEDNLAALRILERESQQQKDATASAQESLDLVTNRYREGAAEYLQVLTAQAVALANERNQIEIERRRMSAAVLLVKALGGGWTEASLPKFSDLR